LGDLIEINKVSLKKNTGFDKIEYIDTSSVTENRFSDVTIIPLNEAPSRAKRVVRDRDIIYSTVRPVQRHYGFMTMPRPNTVVSTGFAVLTPIKIEAKFLYYYLTQDYVVKNFDSIAETNTTTFPAFSPRLFETLEIVIPESNDEQSRIASILSSLDDKIELNLQMNKTLEYIAQAIFKEWFVDFRFLGFDGELADGLPKGWRTGRLGEMIEIRHGYAFSGKDFVDDGNLVVRMGNFGINGGLTFTPDNTKYYKGNVDKNFILNRGDLLVVMSDVTQQGLILGNPGIIPTDDKVYLLNQRVGKVVLKCDHSKFFIYFLMLSKGYKNWVINTANATTVLNTSPKRICDFTFILPDINLIKKFEDMVAPLYHKIENSINENDGLSTIRDTLLPKLMTGKIRVA
jgi:type I restriction enzyme S subunit